MIHYKSGDIILLEFPFTDSNIRKKRPALVILNTNDDDIICARITTQIYQSEFDFFIQNWKDINLLAPSVIRCHKIATLNKSIVLKKLGVINNSDLYKVKRILSDFIK